MIMSEQTTIMLEVIKIVVPTLTIIAAWTSQKRQRKEDTVEARNARSELSTKVDTVTELADGHLSKALADLAIVKKELARVNATGIPTPLPAPGAVVQTEEGDIEVKNRREGDQK